MRHGAAIAKLQFGEQWRVDALQGNNLQAPIIIVSSRPCHSAAGVAQGELSAQLYIQMRKFSAAATHLLAVIEAEVRKGRSAAADEAQLIICDIAAEQQKSQLWHAQALEARACDASALQAQAPQNCQCSEPGNEAVVHSTHALEAQAGQQRQLSEHAGGAELRCGVDVGELKISEAGRKEASPH